MILKFISIAVMLAITVGYAEKSIGVKGGLSLFKSQNQKDRSLYFYNEFRAAPEVSIFCEFGANKFLFHNIQLTYYQAGGKTTDYQSTYVERLDYTGIGYGLVFKVPLQNLLPYISAGVSLDYLVNAKEGMSSDNTTGYDIFHISKYNKFNIRPFLTVGLEYKISRIAIFAEYTFSYNILPFYVNENIIIETGIGEKHNSYNGIKYKTFGQFFNFGCKFDI